MIAPDMARGTVGDFRVSRLLQTIGERDEEKEARTMVGEQQQAMLNSRLIAPYMPYPLNLINCSDVH